MGLNLFCPFKVPPDGGKVTLPTSNVETGDAAGNANGCVWDEMRNGTRLGDCALKKGVFNEVKVKHGVEINAVL